jgi:tellurite resistance protein TehA-like permease
MNRSEGQAEAVAISGRMKAIRSLFPGYFAFVMATGIVSIVTHDLGLSLLSTVLFWIDVAGYAILVILYVLRLAFFPIPFREDLTDAGTTFAFLTFVAGTGVLGARFYQAQAAGVAVGLWVVALVFWILLLYLSFSVLFLRTHDPVEKTVNGGWFLAVVSTQSVSILGSLVSAHLTADPTLWHLFTFGAWAVGIVLYFILIVFIIYRLASSHQEPEKLEPLHWIDMGAAAISTVAGTTLLGVVEPAGILAPLVPLVLGISVLLWAWEVWFIPLLMIYIHWQRFVRYRSLYYVPTLWGMVFPLGMFTKATWNVAHALSLPALQSLAWGFVWVAVVAWAGSFAGLLWSLRPSFVGGPDKIRL